MNNILFAQNIKRLCKNNNIKIGQLLDDLDIRKSLIYDLEKRNKTPSADILIKISDYFKISIDALLGRESSDVNVKNNQFVKNNGDILIGHNRLINNSSLNENKNNLTSNPSKTLHLTEQEKDLLTVFNRSNGKKQVKIMNFIYKIDEEN